jgi:6-phosphogluconate dehydrogenase
MQIGFIGLGKMGTRMVEKLLSDGHTVVGWNRSRDIVEQFRLHLQDKKLSEHFLAADDSKSLAALLTPPRIIWVMLPSGEPTQTLLDELGRFLEKGDVVIDGGNAFYKDTERRSEELRAKGIGFLGIGVSGGVLAADNGYPMMVGGDESAYETITPLLDSLAKPHGGHTYFGEGGAGHFVKMVHNGIEYGMMQAIGEGFGVLDKAPYDLDLEKIAENWQNGTIVSSFLIDRARDALGKDPRLTEIDGEINATGEGEWTINQAKEEGVPIENIEQSFDFRRRSKKDAKVSSSFAARMVAALRYEFGGHAVKKHEA